MYDDLPIKRYHSFSASRLEARAIPRNHECPVGLYTDRYDYCKREGARENQQYNVQSKSDSFRIFTWFLSLNALVNLTNTLPVSTMEQCHITSALSSVYFSTASFRFRSNGGGMCVSVHIYIMSWSLIYNGIPALIRINCIVAKKLICCCTTPSFQVAIRTQHDN